ncbi:MAG: glycerophosphodiester phosphodiesterase [Lacunisphaera sp.]|nr:glycerophosphodiester phosphodiesterase [Lacunisphaera sp.]
MAIPLVIAHRGASVEAPENTLGAFRRALALGVDGIELDVQVTRDGVPVVFHDTSLRRLTGVTGPLATRTWCDLKKLRVHGTEPIPRLAEVLALVRGRAVVQIELKRGVQVAPVVRAIRRARAAKWVILASFELPLLRQAAPLAPDVPRMIIAAGRNLKNLLTAMTALGAIGLSLDHRAVRHRSVVGQIHRHGGRVWCWTVNAAPVMRRLAARGVDAILSDNPALLRRTL